MNLLAHKRDVFSQYGEDGIFQKVFELLGVRRGTCVEFGAWDGKHFSNTANLLLNHAWSGVLIEGSRDKFPDLQATYAGRHDVTLLNRVVGFSSPDTLDEILARTELPRDFDLLSIDIDGNDYHVFESVEVYRPKVVIVEFNPSMPNFVPYVQKKDPAVNHGSSLASLNTLAKRKRYELICCTDTNAIFVDAALFPRFDIANNTVDALHQDIRYQTWVVQMYDGTLHFVGNRKLIWHGTPLDEEKLQVLKPEERRFPDKL